MTGSPPAVFQPLRFQPASHFVIESSIRRESVTMQARLPAGSARRPSIAAVYSMRLFVVCGAPPCSSIVAAAPGGTMIAAQPPGPGLRLQAPSVHTSASPGGPRPGSRRGGRSGGGRVAWRAILAAVAAA